MTTLPKQISLFTEDKSTSLQVGFRANLTQQQVNALEKKMTDTSGQKCLEQLSRFNHVGLWAKMFTELLIGKMDWYSTRCKLIWKLKGTKYNRLYCQLQVLTHRTKGTECGSLHTTQTQGLKVGNSKQKSEFVKLNLLPTPKASEGERGSERTLKLINGKPVNISPKGVKYGIGIRQLAEQGFLPTPVTSDATTGAIIGKNDTFVITSTGMPRKINKQGTDGSVGLARLGKLGMLPTPRETASRGNCLVNRKKGNLEDAIASIFLPTPQASEGTKITGKENQDSITKRVRQQTGKTSQLNPQFVMEMMGFPSNWTVLPFLNGEQRV